MEILLKSLSPKGIAEEMPTMFKEANWIKDKEAPQVATEVKERRVLLRSLGKRRRTSH